MQFSLETCQQLRMPFVLARTAIIARIRLPAMPLPAADMPSLLLQVQHSSSA
jgi:hypothetical protein